MIKKEYLKGEEGKKYRDEIREKAFLCFKESTARSITERRKNVR